MQLLQPALYQEIVGRFECNFSLAAKPPSAAEVAAATADAKEAATAAAARSAADDDDEITAAAAASVAEAAAAEAAAAAEKVSAASVGAAALVPAAAQRSIAMSSNCSSSNCSGRRGVLYSTMLDRAYDIEEEEERLTKQKQVWKAQEDSFYGELRRCSSSSDNSSARSILRDSGLAERWNESRRRVQHVAKLVVTLPLGMLAEIRLLHEQFRGMCVSKWELGAASVFAAVYGAAAAQEAGERAR
ncbi:LOW QUALITY PROTEIN: testis-specific gene A8 protein-like [Cyclospora cayetanensis]|uniref:LOW QUALITY PROTEIN: testis-specific gene A8 protein-like n=1 Tax=Cyclospora cayetanensis TaxID=88456 RepID=A0A6P6RZ49_9EIME|nr:LOW QUALITY PROTEIN: testis-specific gene A8 protein-like [Cyclospora cayetanensis]